VKIHKISITNFKGIKHQSFEFNKNFTVLIGENATGKTTVLDALAVSLGSFFIGLDEVNSRAIRADEVRLVEIDGQPKPQKPVTIEAVGEIDGAAIAPWKREIAQKKTTSKDARSISEPARNKLSLSRQPKEERKNQQEVIFPLIAYHGTGRLWAEHETIKYQRQVEGTTKAYINCLSAKSSSKDFLSWFKTQEDSIKKFENPLEKAHLGALKSTIMSLIPDNRWKDIAFDYKSDGLLGIYTDHHGIKCTLSFNQLSDGFRNIVGMAADLAYRCIQLNPHLGELAVIETPGVVLIDELDLHLHPNWQKNIVRSLKTAFPNVQFIATTHSPFIVQSLEQDELINLDDPDCSKTPNEMPLNKIATQVMGVTNIRSDDFENRVKDAQTKLAAIKTEDGKLTLSNYLEIRQAIGQTLIEETDDPEYKAFLIETGRGQTE
jgi:predicted ATP-binding protein involved in virulence